MKVLLLILGIGSCAILLLACDRKSGELVTVPEPELPAAKAWKIDGLRAAWKNADGYIQIEDLIKKQSASGQDTAEVRFFYYKLLDLDPGFAIDHAIGEEETGLAVQMLAFWSMHDAPAAFRKALAVKKDIADLQVEHPLGTYGDSARLAIARLWVKQDMEAVKTAAAKLVEDDRREVMSFYYAELVKSRPREALQAIRKQDVYGHDEVIRQAARALLKNEGFEKAVSVPEEINSAWSDNVRKDYTAELFSSWAEDDPAAAFLRAGKMDEASGKEFSNEHSGTVFMSAAQHHPRVAFKWLATQGKHDQLSLMYNLDYYALQRQLIRPWEVAEAVTEAGVWEVVTHWTGWTREKSEALSAEKNVHLFNYPANTSVFKRIGMLLDFLERQPVHAFPELWRQCHHREEGALPNWTKLQADIILAAWVKRDAMKALSRGSCYGYHATAGYAYEDGHSEIIAEWFNAKPEEVIDLWGKGKLVWYTHYDEGGGFARSNAAGLIAREWSLSKPLSAAIWYLQALAAAEKAHVDNVNEAGYFYPDVIKSAMKADSDALRAAWKEVTAEGKLAGTWIEREVLEEMSK